MVIYVQLIFGDTSSKIPVNPLEAYEISSRKTYDLHNLMLSNSYPPAFEEYVEGILAKESLLHLRSNNHFVTSGGKIISIIAFEII